MPRISSDPITPHIQAARQHLDTRATGAMVTEIVNVATTTHCDTALMRPLSNHVKGAADFADATFIGTAIGGSVPAVLVHHAGQTWRVKSSPHGNFQAGLQVIMGKVFAMTGLHCPAMKLVYNCPTTPASNRSGQYQIASRFDTSFKDLGHFLRDQGAALSTIQAGSDLGTHYRDALHEHDAAIATQRSIVSRSGPWWSLEGEDSAAYAIADRQRFNALECMNRLLPETLRDDQLRHYIAAIWLANWDHLNVFMENFGYTMTPSGPVGCTVDFDACGPLGCQGRPKALSHDIARQQRPASLFAPPAAFSTAGVKFNDFSDPIGPLDDLTQWPYGFQSASIAELLESRHDVAMDMARRLQRIDTNTMASIVRDLWSRPGLADAEGWPSVSEVIMLLDRRRTQVIDAIGRERIAT